MKEDLGVSVCIGGCGAPTRDEDETEERDDEVEEERDGVDDGGDRDDDDEEGCGDEGEALAFDLNEAGRRMEFW